jgi:hypothetical protein
VLHRNAHAIGRWKKFLGLKADRASMKAVGSATL